VTVILGLSNLVADGLSMGASNYLARRSHVEAELSDRVAAARHGVATLLAAGVIPLLAYLVPLDSDARFPVAIGLAAAALFGVGAARTFVTKRGLLRSGLEMLVVGSLAAGVANAIGAIAASST
jgi:VIT1/CCC1 family predicted Fe2+/Mn2+ transporter